MLSFDFNLSSSFLLEKNSGPGIITVPTSFVTIVLEEPGWLRGLTSLNNFSEIRMITFRKALG